VAVSAFTGVSPSTSTSTWTRGPAARARSSTCRLPSGVPARRNRRGGREVAGARLDAGVAGEELGDPPGAGGVAGLAHQPPGALEVQGDHGRAEVLAAVALSFGECLGELEQHLERRGPEVDADLALVQ
jgi:hypothetical protein